MDHSSESRDGLKEKILLFLEDGKDWIVRNKKIFIPAVIAVLVLLLVGVSLMSRKEDSAEAEDGEVSVIPVPEVPLEENAIAAVNELMNNYYTALADGDIEKLELLRDYIKDTTKLQIIEKSNYIERYDNITCYTKAGLEEDSYIVYVYQDVKLYDFETLVPSLNAWVVYKNESGAYYIHDGELDDNVGYYFTELNMQDDVTNLINSVQAKYNEARASDEALASFLDGFLDLVKEDVAKGLAAMEQENAEDTENVEDTEETTSEQSGDGQTPKVMVTEVETVDTVNVRSSDSEVADKIGKAEKGMRLPLIEKKENGWSKVTFEGKEAYIKSEYLVDVVSVVDETTPAASETSSEENGGEEQSQETDSGGTSTLIGQDGKITAKTTVNIRASANEDGERIGVIYKGEKLELIMQQADGWCKVKYNGQTAYVKTEFME